MKKILVLLSVLLISCASNNSSNNAPNFYPIKGETFFVKNIVVNLDQKCQGHGMPDADELSKLFKSQIEDLLAEKNLLAVDKVAAIGLELDINYKREFVGEAFGICKSYGVSRFGYNSSFIRNDKTLANHIQPEVIPTHGTIGNMVTITKQLTATGGEALEMKNISIFSKAVVGNISKYQIKRDK